MIDRPVARVGPNAILQTAEALRARGGDALARQVFAAAGLAARLVTPPTEMVPEGEAARLHRACCRTLAPAEAEAAARDAGLRTAAYILRYRIPRPARWLLRALPPGLATRLLLAAIARHAWTFAGSGRVVVTPGRPAVIEIAANPLATPGCPWHRGVFEGLVRTLVDRGTEVRETACTARGAPACRFEIHRSG